MPQQKNVAATKVSKALLVQLNEAIARDPIHVAARPMERGQGVCRSQ
jgi:hypothetical protein